MGARRSISSVVLILVLAVAWLQFGPAQLGGRATYVSTHGESMEPTYSASDLVVITRAADHRVGDVIAYRSELLDTVVLHRIVDEDADGFITQGDNNDWLDQDRPTDADILGTPRFHVPRAGRILEVPTPVRATAVTALAALAFSGGRKLSRRRARRPSSTTGTPIVISTPRRRGSTEPTTSDSTSKSAGLIAGFRRRRSVEATPSAAPLDGAAPVASGGASPGPSRTDAAPLDGAARVASGGASPGPSRTDAPSETPARRLTWTGWPSRAAATAAVVGLLSVALAATAFTRPLTTSGDVVYTHRGEFTYTANAEPSLVYPDGRLITGDPVFLRQVDELDLAFTYAVDGLGNPSATGQLWLDLADGSGWSQRSPLGTANSFDGGRLTLAGHLTIPELRRTLTRVADETGVGGGSATITVAAEITVAGSVRGTAHTSAFTPELAFQLDANRLVLRDATAAGAGTESADPTSDPTAAGTDTNNSTSTGTGTGTGTSTTPETDSAPIPGIARTEDDTVTLPDAEPAQLTLAGRSLSVDHARTAASIGLGVALFALLTGLTGAARQRGFDEAARTRARYGRRLVEVDAVTTPAGYGIVDVRDVSTLVELAGRIDRPVLHHRPGPPEPETFIVEGDATVYRYRAATAAGDEAIQIPEEPAPTPQRDTSRPTPSAVPAPPPPLAPPARPAPPTPPAQPRAWTPPAPPVASVAAAAASVPTPPAPPAPPTPEQVHAELESWFASTPPDFERVPTRATHG
ncbi:MAG: signal peptidase I [Nitriliruptor sp.]|uniref:signal peptidase I n=1 Tax=Nitriliruptor sp. TaxID=2448056 RepID=UPI0034A0372D